MGKKREQPRAIVLACMGSKCKHDNKKLVAALKDACKEQGLKNEVECIKHYCTGRCKQAPVLALQPHNVWFEEATEKDLRRMLKMIGE
jgi:(2Fe-2S) ferredoxin